MKLVPVPPSSDGRVGVGQLFGLQPTHGVYGEAAHPAVIAVHDRASGQYDAAVVQFRKMAHVRVLQGILLLLAQSRGVIAQQQPP